MNKGDKQMTEGELKTLEVLISQGYSIPKAASALGRNKTTIYRIFEKNGLKYNQVKLKYIGGRVGKSGKKVEDGLVAVGKKKLYFPSNKIHNKRAQRKSISAKRYCRIEKGSKLENYILEKIKQILFSRTNKLKVGAATGQKLSKDTIYSYIYSNYPELIAKYFRRKGKRYQHKRKQKYQIDQRRMINRRPKSIERRTTLGHWESDTVVGKRKTKTKKCILTNVERKSGYLIARVLENAQAMSVVKATTKAFSSLPKYKRKTMTFDNGREFAYHYDIERELNITTYFAEPYCSWQRGTNENTNGLLRQFLPKGTDFEKLTEKELQKYVVLINNRPRLRLGFMTPDEVFNNKKKSCIGL